MEKPAFYEKLMTYCASLEEESDQIPEARKSQLAELGDFIYRKQKDHEKAAVIVICTHNSRRSHMGQLWLAAAAAFYGLDDIWTASGGTEETAFNTSAVAALQKAGFKIDQQSPGSNPVYAASLGNGDADMQMFSKKYDHPVNPVSGFAAVMVCSEADAACPVVPGADARFPIQYVDPKQADGTPEEEKAYTERCRQIAREMFFAVRHAKQRLAGG